MLSGRKQHVWGRRQKPSCPLPPRSPRLFTGEPTAPECHTSAWSEIVPEKQVLKSITVILPGARQDAQPSMGSQAPLLTPTLRRALLLCMRMSLGFWVRTGLVHFQMADECGQGYPKGQNLPLRIPRAQRGMWHKGNVYKPAWFLGITLIYVHSTCISTE